jgi:nucleoside-diphosphate-sugar epimerase
VGQHILVTGAAGYIGSVLCECLLRAGFEVVGLDNLSHGQDGPLHLCGAAGFEFIRGDARDERQVAALLKRVDVVIPLAAVVGAPACDRDPPGARSVNLDAIRLLNRLRSPEQLVVFPTTNSGYGTKSGVAYCTEETPLEPISLYGETKVQAEAEAARIRERDHPTPRDGLRHVTANAPGPAREQLRPCRRHGRVHRHLREGLQEKLRPHPRRPNCFVHHENVPRMTGRRFNVGLEARTSQESGLIKARPGLPSLRRDRHGPGQA